MCYISVHGGFSDFERSIAVAMLSERFKDCSLMLIVLDGSSHSDKGLLIV